MGDEASAARQQNHEHIEGRSRMAEYVDRKERAPDRPNDCVNGVTGRIQPRDLVGKKLQEIEGTGNDYDPGMTERFEGMIVRRENDPVLIDRETGDENREIK